MAATAAAIAEGIETAQSLVQIVSRSFYGPKQSIVLDQLMRKGAMRDDEIAGRVGMATKDVTKIMLVLVTDQLVSVHRRLELREGAPKASTRTYYYLDYSHATDVIKWRMYKLQSVIDHKLRNELHAQGYVCPRCKAAYKTLDASFLLDPMRGVFVCDSSGCNTELVDNENAEQVQGSKDRMQRLVVQTRRIRDLLKSMNDVVLPKFDPEKWITVHGSLAATALAVSAANEVKIEIAGDDDEAAMKLKREADAEAKRKQNQLPSWIAQSTVSGESTSAHLDNMAKQGSSSFSVISQPSAAAVTASAAQVSTVNDLDSYYESLERAHSLATAVSLPPSPLFSPYATPKLEVTSSDEESDPTLVKVVEEVLVSENGKRSRDSTGLEEDPVKKAKRSGLSEELDIKPVLAAGDVQPTVVLADEEDDDEDEFEEVDEDSNPMISVGGRLLAYNDVKDDDNISASMTSDEYTAYWEVYQRLGG